MTETATLALSDFLLARIAEDEERARDFEMADALAMNGDYGSGGRERAPGYWAGALTIGFPPARVLAECEAKRRIVELHSARPARLGSLTVEACSVCSDSDDGTVARMPCLTLALLALPHAAHPDYRDEWR